MDLLSIDRSKELISSDKAGKVMHMLYQEDAEAGRDRYGLVLDGYRKAFPEGEVLLFTSAGRTEICGNHTDHNHGKVLAASINLDCVAAAGPQ